MTVILKTWYDHDSYTSNAEYGDPNLIRLRALVLFHQFKDEIFTLIIQKLKADLEGYNHVIEEVKRAFEPFVPFVVADALSD